MERYEKKVTTESIETAKPYRRQRKSRGHRMAVTSSHTMRESRSGWGYVKRRSLIG